MRMFFFSVLALTLTSCATSRQPSMPMETAPHPDVRVSGALPEPAFTVPERWSVTATETTDDISVIAEVTLERPEMDGIMYLAVTDAQGMSTRDNALLARADLATILPDVVISDVAEGLTGPDEAVFVAQWQVQGAKEVAVYRTKLIVRTIPGDPKHFALCSGTWPDDAHAFLVTPLHDACQSVRAPR